MPSAGEARRKLKETLFTDFCEAKLSLLHGAVEPALKLTKQPYEQAVGLSSPWNDVRLNDVRANDNQLFRGFAQTSLAVDYLKWTFDQECALSPLKEDPDNEQTRVWIADFVSHMGYKKEDNKEDMEMAVANGLRIYAFRESAKDFPGLPLLATLSFHKKTNVKKDEIRPIIECLCNGKYPELGNSASSLDNQTFLYKAFFWYQAHRRGGRQATGINTRDRLFKKSSQDKPINVPSNRKPKGKLHIADHVCAVDTNQTGPYGKVKFVNSTVQCQRRRKTAYTISVEAANPSAVFKPAGRAKRTGAVADHARNLQFINTLNNQIVPGFTPNKMNESVYRTEQTNLDGNIAPKSHEEPPDLGMVLGQPDLYWRVWTDTSYVDSGNPEVSPDLGMILGQPDLYRRVWTDTSYVDSGNPVVSPDLGMVLGRPDRYQTVWTDTSNSSGNDRYGLSTFTNIAPVFNRVNSL